MKDTIYLSRNSDFGIGLRWREREKVLKTANLYDVNIGKMNFSYMWRGGKLFYFAVT